MERRQLITREDLVNELRRSSFSDANLSTIVHALSSLVDILRNEKEEFSEYDVEDLEMYIGNLQIALNALSKDIAFNLRHYRYIPSRETGLLVYSRSALSFLVLILVNIVLSLGNGVHPANTDHFDIIHSVRSGELYRVVESWAYNGKYNPRHHPFYTVFKRDSQQIFDLMQAGITFISEKQYDLAYYAFQNMLVHLRGVAKEI